MRRMGALGLPKMYRSPSTVAVFNQSLCAVVGDGASVAVAVGMVATATAAEVDAVKSGSVVACTTWTDAMGAAVDLCGAIQAVASRKAPKSIPENLLGFTINHLLQNFTKTVHG